MRRDKFVIPAGTRFRVRVVAKNDEEETEAPVEQPFQEAELSIAQDDARETDNPEEN